MFSRGLFQIQPSKRKNPLSFDDVKVGVGAAEHLAFMQPSPINSSVGVLTTDTPH
jgi:hypothetical protein